MPIKTFAIGDVLTASDVNTYLMRQAVISCTSGTRPSSPADGWTIYETDTDLVRIHNGSTWVIVAGGHTRVVKPTDETVSNATLQDDDHLFLPVAANATYEMRLRLYGDINSASDFKCGWSGPSGFGMRWTVVGAGSGSTDGKLTESDVQPLAGISPLWQTQIFEGTVDTSSTAGTLRFRWAQNGALGGSAIVQSGSMLRLERLT